MKNGLKLFWTDNALFELKETLHFLELYWTEKEIKNFVSELQKTISLAIKNPEIFPIVKEDVEVRKAVVDKNNILYYRVISGSLEVISLFPSRKKPRF